MEQTQYCTDETFMLVRDSKVAAAMEIATRDRQGSLIQLLDPPLTPFSGSVDSNDKFFFCLIIILVPTMVMFTCLWLLYNTEDDQSETKKRHGQTENKKVVEKPEEHMQEKTAETLPKVVSTSDPSSGVTIPAHLCTEFVVPTGLECHVVLPSMQFAFTHEFGIPMCSSISREVPDKSGKSLFVLKVTQIEAHTPSSFFECVLLCKADGSEVGSCTLKSTCEDGHRLLDCMILLSTGELFARLQEEESDACAQERSFSLSGVHPKNPWVLRIHGDIAKHNVEIANIKTGRLLATLRGSEPSAEGYYDACFGSTSDTTLMILAVVAIERLVSLFPKPVMKER